MSDDIELTAPEDDRTVRVIISPADGGRVRQITVGEVGLLAEPTSGDARSTGWGSFPMAPWAGRIRNGRFSFMGTDVALDLNHDDGSGGGGGTISPPRRATSGPLPEQDRDRHSIHGTTFGRPWTVDQLEPSRVDISCDLTGALGWPFAGSVRQRIVLGAGGVDFDMTTTSDSSVFPASLGWHPWFAKPDRLEFDPIAMYEQDAAGLPTGRLVGVPDGPWDDCFVNHRPVHLHYERAVASTVTVSSPTDHWVVFDGPEHATCVEPQTGPPDAPTLRPQVVAPGAPLRITMRIDWT